ncbi:MAG TPA: hypothetical protein DCP36_19530 [Sporomusaceae bacterium]|uniref:hypothetical protein n=1 Tax=Anaerospora sp. TaxID=1960278 RepID=UPI000ECFF3DA|nr:hypothetical protein [Anaerospora sp.]HAK75184.1 hypothetical protein [Sporomusaceae bacterium]
MSTEASNRYTIPFTPLEERISQEMPHLSEALDALRIAIGPADFDKYINSLASLRKVDDQLLLITRKEMYRSVITSRFLPAIKTAFAVSFIRIVNQ